MRRAIMAWLTLGLLLLGPGAGAQTEDPPPTGDADAARLQEAVRLSDLGRLHFEGREFAEAADAFSRAFALHPDPVLGYNAARSFENAGEPERALEHYRATLELPIDDAALRQRCQDGVTRIENILARVEAERQREPARLSVDSEPRGASVLIDGEVAGESPAEIALAAGTYAVQLQYPGHLDYEETVTLEPGQALALRVTLPEMPPPPPGEEGGPTWWAVGLSGGIGVVLVGFGALSAIGAHDRYDEAQTPEVLRDDERFEQVVGEGDDLKRASTFFYGLGIGAIATAVLLYFVTDDAPDDEDGVELDVSVGPDGLGAGFGWRF